MIRKENRANKHQEPEVRLETRFPGGARPETYLNGREA